MILIVIYDDFLSYTTRDTKQEIRGKRPEIGARRHETGDTGTGYEARDARLETGDTMI